MPGRTLPTIPATEVQSHNNKKSCYVTIGTKVYDVTKFLDDHPGGADFILDYAGKDVTEIMQDEVSHTHSEAAYEILDDSLVGFVATEAVLKTATKSKRPDEIVPLPPSDQGQAELRANGAQTNQPTRKVYDTTGMAGAEDLSKDTDYNADYRTHKFLDLNKPLFLQVWNGGFSKDFYLEQIHRPRHYKGGQSAPLFGNFLEPLSKTAWWVVPLCWLPPVVYGTWLAVGGLGSVLQVAGYWMFGLGFWTLIEYILHRCLFHLDA